MFDNLFSYISFMVGTARSLVYLYPYSWFSSYSFFYSLSYLQPNILIKIYHPEHLDKVFVALRYVPADPALIVRHSMLNTSNLIQ